jgi:hypothetical protein
VKLSQWAFAFAFFVGTFLGVQTSARAEDGRGYARGGSGGSASISGAAISPASVSTSFVDAGIVRVNTSLDMQGGAPINFPGTSAGQYMFLACNSQNVRVGADCGGGTANRLNLYAVNGNVQWYVHDGTGDFTPTGDNKGTLSNNGGTCTLNGGSPATCTVSVTAGARCNANTVGTTAAAAKALAINLVTTTLTVTAANGSTEVVNVWCDR